MSIYLFICLLVGASFFLTRFKAKPVECYPINLELIFFNDQAVVCSDGVAVNGAIKFRLEIGRDYTRDQIKKSLLEEIDNIAGDHTSYWLICERDEFSALLMDQLDRKLNHLKLKSMEITRLEEAVDYFKDREKEQAHEVKEQNQVKAEVSRRIEELEKEREEDIARLEAERDAAIEQAEKEAAEMRARAEEEMRLAMEENDRLLKEAVAREEELKMRNNRES